MKTLSIIIVEDEKPQLELLKHRAEQAGFQHIQLCLNEREAIRAWDNTNGFNAVLLDLNLGSDESEGYGLLRYLRSHRNTPQRVFVRSAHLKDKMFSLEAVALHRITFYNKDDDAHELQLIADMKSFAIETSFSRRLPVS